MIALAGNGKGFCGGYDLVESAEGCGDGGRGPGSPLDPATIARNHDPERPWDPVVDWQMMSRNLRGFMSLFHSDKPVLCKVHGFCVAGGTDMALCSDLLVIAADARIGYPPARAWGVPTSALWAGAGGRPARQAPAVHRRSDRRAARRSSGGWRSRRRRPSELDERFEALLERIALTPVNQLVMMKLLVNQALYAQGLHATQTLGVYFDGIARHTPEGYAFQRRAAEAGWREAVRERDEPYGG